MSGVVEHMNAKFFAAIRFEIGIIIMFNDKIFPGMNQNVTSALPSTGQMRLKKKKS